MKESVLRRWTCAFTEIIFGKRMNKVIHLHNLQVAT